MCASFHSTNCGCLLQRCAGSADDGCQVLLAYEHHDGELGVAPGGVARELFDGVGKAACAAPVLALADEDVVLFVADEQVRLALEVEALGGRLPPVVRVQRPEQHVAQVLFAVAGVGRRRSLDGEGHGADDAKDVLVRLLTQDGL